MVKAPILLSPADNHYQQPPPLAAATTSRIVHSVGKPSNRKGTAFSAIKQNRTLMATEPPGTSSLAKLPASSISICSDTDNSISVATQASTSLLVAGSGSGTTAIAVVAPTARTIDNMVVNAQPLCIKTGTAASVTPITVAIPTMPPPMPPLNPNQQQQQQQHQQQHLRNMLHHHHHMQQHHMNAIPIGSAPPPGTTFIAAQQPPGPTGAPPQPQGFVQPPGGAWPMVEPVFHFGPGFERHQRHFCPTHSAQLHAPSEHVVYFHVYPGVSVTFQDGGNREVVRGPVTVPMVSQNGSPPIPMPVQVPPGHVMQQIVDESGTLRHVILSTAHQHQPVPGQGGVQHHIHGHYITANGASPHFYSLQTGYPPGPGQPHFHPLPGPPIPPQSMSHSPHSPSPPNSYHKDERSQRQHTKLLRKLDQQKREISNSALSTPAHSPSSRKNELNGIRRTQRNGASSVGTSEDGEESSSVPDEEDDVQAIIELLSSVQSPQVSEVTSRSALLKWSEPPAPTASENIIYNSRDLRYEVLLSDRGKEGKYKSIFKGPSLSCRIEDLRPGQEYSVCLQVHLEELQGSASEPAIFDTPPCEPDQPFPPKLIQRTKNSLQLRWNAPTDNGSHITQYILESNMGKSGDFSEVARMKSKQYTLNKLESSTMYAFRLAAINEVGQSQYSDIVQYSTSCNPPQQPASPMLQNCTSSTLLLAWPRLTRDEEYTLQMADREYGNGYFNIHTGRENIYECTNLRRASAFSFRLKAENEAGQSPWSEEVIFRTHPERPGQPPKPTVKGKIHANWFKVKWDAPANRGGADIKMYYLEISYGAGFTRIYTGPDCEAICEHLNPGTTYQVRVICEGPGGTSMCSDPCTVTTDAVVPNAPQQPFCGNAPGPYAAVLRWERPIYNGGASVTEYELELENVASQQRLLAYKGREAYGVVKDLLPGELYRVRVRALNRIGAGPWSEEYQFKAGAAPPFAPTNLEAAVRSPTHLTVSWQEPRNNGAAITEYRLESAVMEEKDELFMVTYTGVATQTEVRNLTPFTTYFFRVSAANMAGCSPFSQTILQKTPAAAPAAPQLQDWEVSANDLTLNWLAPESNGADVLHYVIECGERLISTEGVVTTTNNVDTQTLSDTETTTQQSVNTTNTLFIDKLSPESTYKLRIKAVNSIGSGPFSNYIKIQTLPLPPAPPKLECYQSGYNFLKLRWGDGKNLDFQRYYVEMQHGRNKEFQNVYTGTRNTCKVQKLYEMTTYVFRVYAETDRAGTGDYSQHFEFATVPALPNAIKAPRVAVTANGAAIPEDEQQQQQQQQQEMTGVGGNRVTIEWQQSKNNPFQDPVNYLLQMSMRGHASKEQDFKEIYNGPETRYTLDNLNPEIEYSFRVCPVRVLRHHHHQQQQQQRQPLTSPFSPVLHYQCTNADEISPNMSATHHTTQSKRDPSGHRSSNASSDASSGWFTRRNSNDLDETDEAGDVKGVKIVSKLMRFNRKKLSDAHWALIYTALLVALAFIVGSFLK